MSTVPEILRQTAASQMADVFGGNPNTLAATVAKLKQVGQAALATRLSAAIIDAAPLLEQFGNVVGSGVNPLNKADFDSAVASARPNTHGAILSFTHAARPSFDALEENNAGAWTSPLRDGVLVNYRQGPTRMLKWWYTTTYPRFTRVNGRTVRSMTTVQNVTTFDGGVLVSHLGSAILNLLLLVEHDDVDVAQTETYRQIADNLAEWQSQLWEIADEIAALSSPVTFTYQAVPASIVKQYPRGYSTVSILGGADVRI